MVIEISDKVIIIENKKISEPYFLHDFEKTLGNAKIDRDFENGVSIRYHWYPLGINIIINTEKKVLEELRIQFQKHQPSYDPKVEISSFKGNLIILNKSYDEFFDTDNNIQSKDFEFGNFKGHIYTDHNNELQSIAFIPQCKFE